MKLKNLILYPQDLQFPHHLKETDDFWGLKFTLVGLEEYNEVAESVLLFLSPNFGNLIQLMQYYKHQARHRHSLSNFSIRKIWIEKIGMTSFFS